MCQLCVHQLWTSHAMTTLLSWLPLSNTWDFNSINHLSLSRQSKRGLVVLGRLFSGVIHCCSVAIPSTCICINFCDKLSWCLSYMGVRSGVCIALALLLLTMLMLHCSACMITTSESEPFAVFCHPLLAGFY